MMKTALMMGLLLLALLPLALANDHGIGVVSEWTASHANSLAVDAGQDAELIVFVNSVENFNLRIDLLDGNNRFIRTVHRLDDVAANIDAPFSLRFIIPTQNLNAGNYNVVVIAQNTRDSDVVNLRLQINAPQPVNQPPVFDPVPDQAVGEGQELVFRVNARDPEGQPIRYRAEFMPVGATFNNQQFRWVPTFDQSGVYRIAFIASDGQLESRILVGITVNNVVIQNAPVIVEVEDQAVDERSQLRLEVSAWDLEGDAIRFTAERCDVTLFGACFNFGFNDRWWSFTDNGGGTGEFVFSPDYTHVLHPRLRDTDHFELRARDATGRTSKESFRLTVQDVNRRPQFTSRPFVRTFATELYTYDMAAQDADAEDTITFRLEMAPQGMVVADNQLRWTPTLQQVGRNNVRVTVNDGIGGSTFQDFNLIVVERQVVEPDSDGDGIVDNLDNCPLIANPLQEDADGNGVGDACEPIIPPVDTDNDGIPDGDDNCPLIANPLQEDADGNGVGDACEPIIPPVDTDNDGIPDGDDNCPLIVNPLQEDADGNGVGDACERVPGNQPPVIVSSPVRAATQGTEYRYQIQAFDPEGNALRYSLMEAPQGMAISDFGLVLWMPDSEDDTMVVLTVFDGEQSIQQRFSIQVGERRKNFKIMSAGVLGGSSSVVYGGDVVPLKVHLSNNGDEDLEDVRVRAFIYELGAQQSSREFDLEVGDDANAHVNLQVPYDALPGEYVVEITVGNSHFHDTIYRPLVVG